MHGFWQCKTMSLALLILLCTGSAVAQETPLKVAVLESSPPMGYRDSAGKLTGFGTAIAKALCDELQTRCVFEPVLLEGSLDRLAAGEFDIVAIGLLNTPERASKVVFTKPVYRSVTLWVAKPGVRPGNDKIRVSTFGGSAHEKYVRTQNWDYIVARNLEDMLAQFQANVAQAAIVPLMTSFSLMRHPAFKRIGLEATVMPLPELGSNACFALNPRRAHLKDPLDQALDKIKRNGIYDRINSEFLPFRVE